MKNTRALVMIGISIFAALAAVWIAARWVSQETNIRTGKVVVANADIDIGSKLTGPMVRVADWPIGSVPAGAVSDASKIIDRVILINLQRGEPVLDSKLAPEGAKAGLSAIVAKGKRAITVKVNEVVGVAGFALPGNYVDVMVNTQDEAAKGADKDNSLSKIVLERILVLAVAQETSTDANKPKVVSAVTLEVTPEEAEKLDLARSVGNLSLVLRNQVDQDAVKTVGTTKAKLLGMAREPAPAPRAATAAAAASAPTKKPATTRRASPQQVAAVPRNCVVVLTGMETSRECF
jgi:pilus assembly protein CpaB